jgi:molybdopterin-guanine dinucleotide biosynthesis adapter protein
MPKLIAVVGGKHSGKTTIIEQLITELSHRGYHVGTIKEMARIPTLDTPQTETDRYRQAGAEAVVAVPRNETVLFIPKRLTVKEILPHLKGLDYVLIEGFESERWLPKIVAAKTAQEAQSYFDGSIVAISGIITDSPIEMQTIEATKIPMHNSKKETKKLADIAEAKASEQILS